MAELKPFELIMRVDFAMTDGKEVIAHAEKVKELIRCRNCRYFTDNEWCDLMETFAGSEDFCSWSERIERK